MDTLYFITQLIVVCVDPVPATRLCAPDTLPPPDTVREPFTSYTIGSPPRCSPHKQILNYTSLSRAPVTFLNAAICLFSPVIDL